MLEGIGTLVDDSLVRNIPDEQGRPRLAMLETIRSYAASSSKPSRSSPTPSAVPTPTTTPSSLRPA